MKKSPEIYYLQDRKIKHIAIKLRKQPYNNRLTIFDFKAKARILDLKVRKNIIMQFLKDKNFTSYNPDTIKKNLKSCGFSEPLQTNIFGIHQQLQISN